MRHFVFAALATLTLIVAAPTALAGAPADLDVPPLTELVGDPEIANFNFVPPQGERENDPTSGVFGTPPLLELVQQIEEAMARPWWCPWPLTWECVPYTYVEGPNGEVVITNQESCECRAF